MKVFISGGCKNGKSTYAQKIAKKQQNGSLYYVATMISADHEDDERILRHVKERDGWGFVTIEQPTNIAQILEKCDTNGSFLLDSLTALLSNEMFSTTGEIDENAHERIAEDLSKILRQIQNIVIVSDYIYSDAIQYDRLTELYRKSLAYLDRFAASHCDIVLEAAYGQIITHKGGDIF